MIDTRKEINNHKTILMVPGAIAPAFGPLWEYFYKIPSYLKDKYNFDIHVVELPTWGNIFKRSRLIEEYIDTNLAGKNFHIIGHSKGGPEVRYLLEQGNINSQVLSFTSISCPYQGSTVATLFYYLFFPLKIFSRNFIESLKELRPGVYDQYWKKDYLEYSFPCFYAASDIPAPVVFNTYPLFWLTYPILKYFEGKNDGFVSIKSASFGKCLEICQTDHIGMIGQFYGKTGKFEYFKIYDLIISSILK